MSVAKQKPKQKEAEEASKPKRFIRPKTDKQKQLLQALDTADFNVVYGSAGTGKSYICSAYAAVHFMRGNIDKIILTRPNVAAGRTNGFLPGTLEEKMHPYMVPFLHTLEDFLGKAMFDACIKTKAIEIVPFEFMRGRSFDNCLVILDEAQNTTVHEIQMFLTRQGEGSKVIVNGDVKQSDIKESSGLHFILAAIENNPELKGMSSVTEFSIDDCVRSGIVKLWLKIFDSAN